MSVTPQLPAGETLPPYDDEHSEGADIYKMWQWISERPGWYRGDPTPNANMIRMVLSALQAVGGATLVKNDTYRAMRRDGVDIERLTAWLANHGLTASLIEHDGNPVDTAITGLTAALALAAKAAANGGDS